MSTDSEDAIVYRRHSKGRIHKDVTKRVSFDENALNDTKIKELKVLHCADNIKSDEFELELLKRSLDKCYEAEKCDLDKRGRDTLQSTSRTCTPIKRISGKEFPSFLERGTPEGQEDPHRYSSSSSLQDCGKDLITKGFSTISGSRKSTYCIPCERHSSAKALLVKKFLKSIEQRNIRNYKLLHDKSRITSLYIKNIKRSAEVLDHSVVTNSLFDEIRKNERKKENIVSSLNSSLLELVNTGVRTIYKVYKVLTVEGCPVLAVITTDSLFIASYCHSNKEFTIEYSCNFETLLAAVLGPFSQLVIVLNENDERFFVNTGLSDSVASDLISHLEIALRRWCASMKREFNFNVAQINDLKYMKTFHNVLPDHAFSEDETLIAQYSVWLQEDYVETSSPLGPEKEGYLMTKIGVESSWTPTYLCLKCGVLYLFEKNSQRIPKFAIPLRSTIYKGCRIHNNAERPHSFAIILEGNSSFNFGAADETEMMEWIRDLYSSAVQISNVVSDVEKESPVVSCFVTLSTNQILLHRFPNCVISRASLVDVTSFTKSCWPESYYCILELCCREASEMGGDWILYFVSEDSYKNFCSKFSEITYNFSVRTEYIRNCKHLEKLKIRSYDTYILNRPMYRTSKNIPI